MSSIYKIYDFFLKIARFFGLNNRGWARGVADSIKSYLRSHMVPFVISVRGFKIRGLSLMDYIVGAYEPETTKLFEKIVKKGQTIIDIGADYGYFSLLAAKLVGPYGKVFAFEPYKERCEQYLSKNISLNKFRNTEIVQKAASDTADSHMYFADSRSLFNINNTVVGTYNGVDRETVDSVRLDDFFKNYDRPIDLIKIDAEGGEMNVLKGAHDVLERNKNIKLILEVAPRIMRAAGLLPDNLLLLLRTHGFVLHYINSDGSVAAVRDEEIISRAESAKYANIFCSRV